MDFQYDFRLIPPNHYHRLTHYNISMINHCFLSSFYLKFTYKFPKFDYRPTFTKKIFLNNLRINFRQINLFATLFSPAST